MPLKLSLLLIVIAHGLYAKSPEEYIQHFLEQDQPDLLKIDFLVVQHLMIEEVDLNEKWRNLEQFNLSDAYSFDCPDDVKETFTPIRNDSVVDFTFNEEDMEMTDE